MYIYEIKFQIPSSTRLTDPIISKAVYDSKETAKEAARERAKGIEGFRSFHVYELKQVYVETFYNRG